VCVCVCVCVCVYKIKEMFQKLFREIDYLKNILLCMYNIIIYKSTIYMFYLFSDLCLLKLY